MTSRGAALLALVAALVWYLTSDRNVAVPDADGSLGYPGYRLIALESFAIEARVLSRKDYSHDREADLSPTDLALGWGRMADPAVTAQMTITQGGRWFRWKARSLPIPRHEINTSAANVHIIPATEEVAERLADVRKGDTVHLQGDLVRVEGDDGWRWVSSTSRTDTGRGSCELLLLRTLAITSDDPARHHQFW